VNSVHVLWTLAAALAVVVTAVAIHRARQHRAAQHAENLRVIEGTAAIRSVQEVAMRVLTEPTQQLPVVVYGRRRPPAPRGPCSVTRTHVEWYVTGEQRIISATRMWVAA